MREVWFENGSVRLFAVEDGAGQVIVMLHGAMANHLASLPFVASLSSRYRVIPIFEAVESRGAELR